MGTEAPPYAELQCLTNFSFLEGASHAQELVIQAKALGLSAIGVADRNSLAGVVRAHVAAKEHGLQLLIGARLDFTDAPSVIAYPKDRDAYGRLTRLITLGRRRAEKGNCILSIEDLFPVTEGLLLIYLARDSILSAPIGKQAERLSRLMDAAASDDVFLAASHLLDGEDRRRIAETARLAQQAGCRMIATNDVLMHERGRRPLADVLSCVREKTTIDHAGLLVQRNAERHLKPPREMARLFEGYEDALAATQEIADRCRFSLDELRYEYPDEIVEPGKTAQESLIMLTWQGAKNRYPGGVPAKVRKAIEHELALIEELGFAPYFLTVYDLVRFAREQEPEILCQGRGSAANSTVCYCLGVTSVSPQRVDLLFERFISAERGEPPDIDVDFEHERREEVIQYIYGKYGRHRAGLSATVISYRARGAIRDIGKAMGLSEDVTGLIASQVWGWSNEGTDTERLREVGLDPADRRLRQTMALIGQAIGFPRHLSQHVGGFVISRGRLDELVPVENAAMENRTVIQWDKDDLSALGLLKVDVLALGMLSCVRKGFDLLRAHYGRSYTLATVPEGDTATYDMLCQADSLGVFQVESRAQMSFLPRMKPRNYYDLVIEVAIVRPGPIQGDMVHPYLRRRNKEEKVEYPSPELKAVLEKTYGVPLFQEQAMKVAIVAAGFTPAEADRLRRAMATFRKNGEIHLFREKMIQGMVGNGYEHEFAERCFKQIEGFGDYGFPESHAASFALLVYVSAWMKCHYPAVFACALLNSQPMGFYAPAQIIRDARDHGVQVLPADVNHSDWDCTLEPAYWDETEASAETRFPCVGDTSLALRLGLRQIKGLNQGDAEEIVGFRGNHYDQPIDLWRRAGIGRRALEVLARGDAFSSMGLSRRQALWAVRGVIPEGKNMRTLPLFEHANESDRGIDPPVSLPEASLGEEVVADYSTLRFSLKAHPLALLRHREDRQLSQDTLAQDLMDVREGARVSVSGLVLVRQRPGSAKGVIFVTLEDETGVSNIVVWSKTFETYRRNILAARLMQVTGKLQREGIVIHIVADRIEDRSGLLDSLSLTEAQLRPLDSTMPPDEARRPVYSTPPSNEPGISPDPHRGAGYRPMKTPIPPTVTAKSKAVPRPRHPRDQARVIIP